MSLEFFIDTILPIDPVSNRNEYQENFLGGKGGWCVRLTNLPLSCADCLKSWSFDLLEPSGPAIGLYRDCFNFIHLIASCNRILMNSSLNNIAAEVAFALFPHSEVCVEANSHRREVLQSDLPPGI